MQGAQMVFGTRIKAAQRVDLRLGEAIEVVLALAQQDLGIEAAVFGVAEDAVFDAVDRIAGVESGFLDCGKLQVGDVGAGIEEEMLH